MEKEQEICATDVNLYSNSMQADNRASSELYCPAETAESALPLEKEMVRRLGCGPLRRFADP